MTLFVILLAMLITALIIMLIIWSDYNDGKAKIAFKDFKKIYELNNNRWILQDNYVYCKTLRYPGSHESFTFKFFDFWKYKLWLRKIKKEKVNKTHMESTKRMLDAVKEDIKNTQTNAERSFEEYIRTVMEFAKNNGHDTTQLEDILRRVEKQNEKL